ncbi:MAG: hypothetical protein FJ125_00715 [Deltaproteobacteria bacterium]|nr:hypothetical protein [Deltaproteobacteria bacterium]
MSKEDEMAKTAQKATVGRPTDVGYVCPKDAKKMVATKVVRHEGRSGMFWVCECGFMQPVR